MISCSPGRHPSSSLTGNVFRPILSGPDRGTLAPACRESRPHPVSIASEFHGGRRTIERFLRSTPEEAPLQLRIPTPELVPAARPAAAVGTQHRALPFRPSRCTRSLETHRRFRLHPRYKG